MPNANNPPLTPSERAARSRRRTLDDGAQRVEAIIRDPAALAALAALVEQHGSQRAAIEALLLAAGQDPKR